jgi:NAD-dependent dihydropyrimidine dehydrogenase PreA subunit
MKLKDNYVRRRNCRMSKITIDRKECDGAECAECAEVCAAEILIVKGDEIIIQNPEECDLCENCMDICPNEAIEVEED